MWNDATDERVERGIKHLLDFARCNPGYPGQALEALAIGLEPLSWDRLCGISEAACARLLDAIGEAERAAEQYPWHLGERAARGFAALTLLAASAPQGAGALNPELRIAATRVRALHATARAGAELYAASCCPGAARINATGTRGGSVTH